MYMSIYELKVVGILNQLAGSESWENVKYNLLLVDDNRNHAALYCFFVYAELCMLGTCISNIWLLRTFFVDLISVSESSSLFNKACNSYATPTVF